MRKLTKCAYKVQYECGTRLMSKLIIDYLTTLYLLHFLSLDYTNRRTTYPVIYLLVEVAISERQCDSECCECCPV